MEMICPECLGTLVTQDGVSARCPLHGGQYKILFQRDPAMAVGSHIPPGVGYVPPQGVVAPPAFGPPYTRPSSAGGWSGPATVPSIPGPYSGPGVASQPLPFPPPGARCVIHPQVAAICLCASCGAPVCETCQFPLPNGAGLCPRCAAAGYRPGMVPGPVAGPPPPSGMYAPGGMVPGGGVQGWNPQTGRIPDVLIGKFCAGHPEVQAQFLCHRCRVPICATCAFDYPGGVHLCPTCASRPDTRMSARRRGMVIASFALAVIATVGIFGALVLGAAGGTDSEEAEMVMGVLFFLMGFLPSMVGLGLGISTMERNVATPASVWIASIWNGLVLGVFILLSVVGAFMG